ncbi:RM14 protein, partial [Pseudoatta argentina]
MKRKRGILVGLKQEQVLKVPKFDSNNLIFIDDNRIAVGTRIRYKIPIPHIFRKKRLTAKEQIILN